MQVLILAIVSLALGLTSVFELVLLVVVLRLMIQDKMLRTQLRSALLTLAVTLSISATVFYFLVQHLFRLF